MDVDGTLTDGKIYMSANGEIFKKFDIKDGYGIHDLLPQAGIEPVIITGRASQIVTNRSKELGINYIYQGCQNKVKKLKEVARQFGLSIDENGRYQGIAYIGDDMNDLPSIRLCEVTGCPADAAKEVKRIASFVSTKSGGNGAVREFIEWILDNQN